MRTKRLARLLAASVLLSVFNSPAPAGVPAEGGFTATQNCQAYHSIRRKTNPGEIRLDIGHTYPIVELNTGERATWYRLRIENATPPERWAYFECGAADIIQQGSTSPRRGAGGDCHVAGLEDGYVLALTWQPAFCEGHRSKPECMVTDPDAYQATHFTLHGLWPNRNSCGTHYGWCGKYREAKRPFCRLPSVPMQGSTREALGRVMPSAAHGSCLQRHEWYKHGTCQMDWDADGYFMTAAHLLKEFNTHAMAAFMEEHLGESVSSEAFFDAVDKAFGPDAHRRLQIACRGGRLVDIYVHLPAEFPADASLGELIQEADPNFQNRCGTEFVVDPIGFQ